MATGRLREILRGGEIALGLANFIGNLELTEIMGHAGLDFNYVDMHQTPLGFESVQRVVCASDAVGMSSIVRVVRNDPNEINRALNLGPDGVVVPHVKTPQEAEAVVRATKYKPQGERGAYFASRAASYSRVPWPEHVERANREMLVGVMIEDLEGVENLDSILAVPGIDIVFIGPRDLSESLGLRGETFLHPEMRRLLKQVTQACRDHGITTWTSTTSGTPTEVLVGAGVQMIHFGTDHVVFFKAVAQLVEVFRREAGKTAPKGDLPKE